jgi:predicted CoA-binding protein
MSAAQTVAILGASSDPERYAFKAQRLLKEHGHRVIPVSAKEATIDGDATVAQLRDIEGAVDTLTLYVRPAISSKYREQIEALKPGRVIFNPGTENEELAAALRAAGIDTEEACTLVMLRTGHF